MGGPRAERTVPGCVLKISRISLPNSSELHLSLSIPAEIVCKNAAVLFHPIPIQDFNDDKPAGGYSHGIAEPAQGPVQGPARRSYCGPALRVAIWA